MTAPSILEVVTDPGGLALALSPAQRTLLKGIYGLALDEEERALWTACTGRAAAPRAGGFQEVTVCAGARAGKDSRIAAPVVIYEAVFGGHERHLGRGERGVIPLVAQDARGAKIAFSYVRDYVTRSPLLAAVVVDVLASEIVLRGGLRIEVFPCTVKSLRGWSIPAAVLDEVGFWRLEGQADSDAEVQASVRRGMVHFARTRLVKISTPYMKSGVLYEDVRRAFGRDDPDLLVWKASSRLMNPALRAERLERERRLDPQRYAREYEAEFAEDLESFLPGAWVDHAVVAGCHERPPGEGLRYVAAVDASAGGADAFTLSVVHLERDYVVQDVMKGWARPRGGTVDLEGIVGEIARLVARYGLHAVVGDRFAAGWTVQAFRRAGVRYELPELRRPDGETTYMSKSMAYAEAEPLFAQGRVQLLDHPQLVRELKLLERRPRAGGTALIDHPAGGHDDFANSLCLAAALVARQRPRPAGGAPLVLPKGVGRVGEPARGGRRVAAGGLVDGVAAWARRWER